MCLECGIISEIEKRLVFPDLGLWISSTAPRNPMIIVAGRNADGNSGTLANAV